MPYLGFPGSSDGKASACNVRDLGLEDPPGEGIGNPLQYSCLEDSMNRGDWQATGGHKESDTTKQLTLSPFGKVIQVIL